MKPLNLKSEMKPLFSPSASPDVGGPVRVGGDISVAGQDVVLGVSVPDADSMGSLFPYLKSLNKK